jgi:uncharacterized secreted protein with C-terminal beta-propeller domain
VDIYDVSDRENPVRTGSLSQSGRYADSRMIGDKLYLISTYDEFDYAAMDEENPRTYVPLFSEGSSQFEAAPDEIFIPGRVDVMSYVVVSGVDASTAKFVSHESLLGDSYTVYASRNNLYLTAGKYDYTEKEAYGHRVRIDSGYTRVTRLSLNDGAVKTEASADVPGAVNDQFSLDEYDGTLRVVTTKDESVYAEPLAIPSYGEVAYPDIASGKSADGAESPPEPAYSEEYYASGGAARDDEPADGADEADKEIRREKNRKEIDRQYGELVWDDGDYGYRTSRSTGLYALDMNLKIIGKVDDLAPDEMVYACRYMGDVAYFVTFRNTDPLFSVDLRDPARPKVMGELKIPGFSEYLHPYADGLLFGLGSDADERTGETKGLKVSMFDNSDPWDVTEKRKLIIDDMNYTYASDNHKAVLVDAGKSLIAFPADDGYVIIRYDEDEGFSRVMDVTLKPAFYEDMWHWYGGLRGIFIGDVFYVVAPDSIHAYDMNDGFKAIGSVSLGSGAKYEDRNAYGLPPGHEYDGLYGDIPVGAYVE